MANYPWTLFSTKGWPNSNSHSSLTRMNWKGIFVIPLDILKVNIGWIYYCPLHKERTDAFPNKTNFLKILIP